MGPLTTGGLAGIAGLGCALWVGAPALAALAAYSLCGALGVLGGGMLMMRAEPEPALARTGRRATVPTG